MENGTDVPIKQLICLLTSILVRDKTQKPPLGLLSNCCLGNFTITSMHEERADAKAQALNYLDSTLASSYTPTHLFTLS